MNRCWRETSFLFGTIQVLVVIRRPSLEPRFSRAAARLGRSARTTAALTAIRVAPAASTRSTFSSVIPPMANQGMFVVSAAACTKARPASSGSENSLVALGKTGPTPT